MTTEKRIAEAKKQLKQSLDRIGNLQERVEEEDISYGELATKLHNIGKSVEAVGWYIREFNKDVWEKGIEN